VTGAARACATLLLALALGGCAQTGSRLGYYWQSLRGHVALMQAARPLDDWLSDPATPAPLRSRLELARQARAFAVDRLALPDNASYRRYAQLNRRYAVWNVVAAPPYALELHRWCFPVTGCIGYRGYFAQADAQAEAARLQAQGQEVSVYGVPAYSTLGYSNWLGGDPLLSTFLGWPEGDFVRLLFHELAHQQVYAEGDTQFNESYATAVARLGVALWLAQPGKQGQQRDYAASEQRRRQWRALTQAARAELGRVYAQGADQGSGQVALAARKAQAFADWRAAYARLRAQWLAQGVAPARMAGMDDWVRQANNASLAAQAAYDGRVDAFVALFEREGDDWPRFHAAVRDLARQDAARRWQVLDALQPGAAGRESPAQSSAVPAAERDAATDGREVD
jgi:predicted aminopeptidase